MPLSQTETQDIADAFVNARRAGRSMADYPGRIPETLAEAYAIQDSAIARFGEDIVGWKVGRINTPWLEKLGSTRLSGPIFASTVPSPVPGAVPEGLIFANGFGAAEAEFVFQIGIAPRAGQRSFTVDDVLDMIDTVYCGFEIASSPFAGINSTGPLVTISDFGNNHGLLLGAEIPDWRNSGFEQWRVSTLVDGLAVGSGQAAAFPGGTLESVRFLIENLVARSMPVLPGMLISSGAVSGVHEVRAGQTVEAQFGPFCTMNCGIRHVKIG